VGLSSLDQRKPARFKSLRSSRTIARVRTLRALIPAAALGSILPMIVWLKGSGSSRFKTWDLAGLCTCRSIRRCPTCRTVHMTRQVSGDPMTCRGSRSNRAALRYSNADRSRGLAGSGCYPAREDSELDATPPIIVLVVVIGASGWMDASWSNRTAILRPIVRHRDENLSCEAFSAAARGSLRSGASSREAPQALARRRELSCTCTLRIARADRKSARLNTGGAKTTMHR